MNYVEVLMLILSLAIGCGRSNSVDVSDGTSTAQVQATQVGLVEKAESYSNSPSEKQRLLGYQLVANEVSTVSQSQSLSALSCGRKLLTAVGRTGKEALGLPALYLKHSRRKDEEFLKYMFAVIYVESGFERNVKSEKEAYGLMQMTAVAVQDAQTYCKLRPLGSMDHLFDSVTNIRYGTCFLQKAYEDTDGDWTRVLILYNGGFKQLTKYDKGENIASETANYVLRINRALSMCIQTTTEGNEE